MIDQTQEQENAFSAVFETLESEVRSYCRTWPAVFDRAVGSWLYDEQGRPYLDFFAGAGALNYGHNNPYIKRALLDYLAEDRVLHSLDMFTVAKREFLAVFDELILTPRELDYRVQFPGPGGTQATEAALKLARKITGRSEVICFGGGFHGMTVGSLAVTANPVHRRAAGLPLDHATPLPYNESLDGRRPDFGWLDRLLEDTGSGLERPAGVIVEAVQGEGGINVATVEWLRGLADRCRRHEIPLILDDVQMGCGRTGPFFSFETAGIKPDIVCLSKSISGIGQPMALTLIRRDLDVWEPGEHTGTFRGFNPAFITATAALRAFWSDERLERATLAKGRRIQAALEELVLSTPGQLVGARGRGMARGLACADGEVARNIAAAAFDRGLLVETAGPDDEVVKLLPALTTSDEDLEEGLHRLGEAVRAMC